MKNTTVSVLRKIAAKTIRAMITACLIAELYIRFYLKKIAPVANSRLDNCIVSIKTIDKRLPMVHYGVISMLSQSRPPQKIILWLDEKRFSTQNLPKNIKKLLSDRFETRFTSDIGPATKLIPAIKAFPDKNIVTVHDDTIYPSHLLETLYASWQSAPNSIHAHRVRRIGFTTDERLLPYATWQAQHTPCLSTHNFFIGVGGVLYPPGSLSDEVFDIARLKQLSYFADDIWFFAMMILKGGACMKTPNRIKLKFREIPFSQLEALNSANVGGGKNDECLKKVFDHYRIWDILKQKE